LLNEHPFSKKFCSRPRWDLINIFGRCRFRGRGGVCILERKQDDYIYCVDPVMYKLLPCKLNVLYAYRLTILYIDYRN